MNRISWSIQRALGITDEEARNAELRAQRIEEANRPDGAREYVNVSDAGLKFASIRDGYILSDKKVRKILGIK